MLYTITTESGATYQFDGMHCYHRGFNIGRVAILRRIEDTEIDYGVETPYEVIQRMEDCGPGEIRVGDRIYVDTRDYWRLASRVVSVVEE